MLSALNGIQRTMHNRFKVAQLEWMGNGRCKICFVAKVVIWELKEELWCLDEPLWHTRKSICISFYEKSLISALVFKGKDGFLWNCQFCNRINLMLCQIRSPLSDKLCSFLESLRKEQWSWSDTIKFNSLPKSRNGKGSEATSRETNHVRIAHSKSRKPTGRQHFHSPG